MKRCPFCGCEESFIVQTQVVKSMPPNYYNRHCNDCGVNVWGKTVEECNAKWECRVPAEPIAFSSAVNNFRDELEINVEQQIEDTLDEAIRQTKLFGIRNFTKFNEKECILNLNNGSMFLMSIKDKKTFERKCNIDSYI